MVKAQHVRCANLGTARTTKTLRYVQPQPETHGSVPLEVQSWTVRSFLGGTWGECGKSVKVAARVGNLADGHQPDQNRQIRQPLRGVFSV
jgi:hypothetical protein